MWYFVLLSQIAVLSITATAGVYVRAFSSERALPRLQCSRNVSMEITIPVVDHCRYA